MTATVLELTAVHARTSRGDLLGQLDDLAEILHDHDCGCRSVGDRRGCWAWTSGRFHRAAERAQREGVRLADRVAA
jgi:hypothetical protein